MNLKYKLDDQNYRAAVLETLVTIAATQKATAYTLITMLALDQDERDKYIRAFDQDAKNRAEDLCEHIYATKGMVDINEILKP